MTNVNVRRTIASYDEDKRVSFHKGAVVGRELEYLAGAVEAFAAGDTAEVFIPRCERLIEKQLGAGTAILTHSGTSALEMAAILCDCRPGDEFIMPSFTFPSTANAFVLRGGVPVFVDIRADNLTMDEDLIDAAVTKRTKGIVPVHYGGVACELETIMEIAAGHHIIVIEDAAQAYLSRHRGKSLGTIGSMGALSFHKTKNITGGEGGALLLNDERLATRARIISDKGTNRFQFFQGEVPEYSWVDIGSSYRASELVAAFLYAQLEAAETITEARTAAFKRYSDQLRPLADEGRVHIPHVRPQDSCNGHLFYLVTRNRDERDRLIGFLQDNGITATWHFVPLHQSHAGQEFGRVSGTLTVTETFGSSLVRLPLYYRIADDEVDFVVDRVLRFYAKVA